MATKIKNNPFWLLVILIIAFLVRVYNLSFPSFTPDEARVAYRGHVLATYGKDELGRTFPVLFNSLEDYQLPIVSYLTAGGQLLFGKSEFGARIPFIIIGTLLVFLIYKIAKFFSPNKYFWLTSAFLIAFSPPLIFLSKTPNETVVLTFLLTLLFYLIASGKSLMFILPIMVISILTSKQSWFILSPFIFFTLLFQKSLNRKNKLILIGLSITLTILAFALFKTVPQSIRSLLENNFSIFSNITIKNGIDKLRGQGIESGWPNYLERFLFNKSYFLIVGFLHWLSHMSPAVYFGRFDGSGKISYSFFGAFAKILLIPLVYGLIFLVKSNGQKTKSILIYLLVLTFPSLFVYPDLSLNLIVLTLPFVALVIAVGMINFSRRIQVLILFLTIFETIINIYLITPEYKNTTLLRPTWVKQLSNDIFEKSKVYKTAVSDDIVTDITPYIKWYTLAQSVDGLQQIPYPYKFRQYLLGNIKIIASEEKFNTCGKNERVETFVSKRDLGKLNELNINIIKVYKDSNKEERAYLVDTACIK